MKLLIDDTDGMLTFYGADTGRLFTFEKANNDQRRNSSSTYPDIHSARKAYLEKSVLWDKWTTGWPESLL